MSDKARDQEKKDEKPARGGNEGRAEGQGTRTLRNRFGRFFNYANNPLSILGIVLATVSGLSILTFLLVEWLGHLPNPYIGIFAYLILPGVFVVGLVLIPIGMVLRRRKLNASGVSQKEQLRYPRLDFNDPALRRVATLVLVLTAVNAVIFGSSSFLAVEHMESVEFCGTTCHTLMTPEYTAYQDSPHSQVACVECHIGPGTSWFIRSKVDGLRQVWATLRDSYEKPIGTPIHTLRPARETCEECHWPAKHYADKLRVFARFDTDEENTASYSAMVLQTGGGSRELGEHGGIHWWHIYSDNKIRYYGSENRETISWVELTTADGEVRTYTREGEELPPAEMLGAEARVMDCIDCHNRPTHLLELPSKALDAALASRPELARLPYYKREAMAAIEGEYPTRVEGMAEVTKRVEAYYSESYPDIWQERRSTVEKAAEVAGTIYGRSVFPEMSTNWETHRNNIGHEDSPGCFRCHDEELATADGEHVITFDCETCHTFLVEDSESPVDFGALAYDG